MPVDGSLRPEPPAAFLGKFESIPVECKAPENDIKELGRQVAGLLTPASDRFEFLASVEERSGAEKLTDCLEAEFVLLCRPESVQVADERVEKIGEGENGEEYCA